MNYYGIAVTKKFLKNDRLAVSIVANNFVERYKYYNIDMYEKDVYSLHISDKINGRTIRIKVSWSFGEMKSEIKKSTKTIENTDLKESKSSNRVGGNSGMKQGRKDTIDTR